MFAFLLVCVFQFWALAWSCACPCSRFNILWHIRAWNEREDGTKEEEKEKVRVMSKIRDWLLITVALSGGRGKMEEHKLFSFCLDPPPFPLHSFTDWLRETQRERGLHKRDMSFLLYIPSLSFFVSVLISFSSVFANIELRVNGRQKETTAAREQGGQKERKTDGRKEKYTHMHISSIYFTTKQSKSAWRKDFPVSNSQIKQELIKTLPSPVVPQIIPTNSISWKHTLFTQRQ